MPKIKGDIIRIITSDNEIIEYDFYSFDEADQWFRFLVSNVISGEMKHVVAVYLCVKDYVQKSFCNHVRLHQTITFNQLINY